MVKWSKAALAIIACAAMLPACAPPDGPGTAQSPAGDALAEAASTTPLPSATPTPTVTASPTSTPTPSATPSPTPTPTPPAWQWLAPGLAQAQVPIPIPEMDNVMFYAYVVRIDPELATFRVFHDGLARDIEDWQSLTRGQVVVNGGFFSGDNYPVGRLVMDGGLIGRALDPEQRIGVPGLFTVLDGEVAIYALGRSTYTPRGLRFDQAIEAYPLLLLPGRQPAYPASPDDPGTRARRTVVGLDEEGHVIIMVIDGPVLSLYELSHWLAESNLNLDIALNFDGGRSSALAVQAGGERTVIPAYVPLPIVLAVYSGGR